MKTARIPLSRDAGRSKASVSIFTSPCVGIPRKGRCAVKTAQVIREEEREEDDQPEESCTCEDARQVRTVLYVHEKQHDERHLREGDKQGKQQVRNGAEMNIRRADSQQHEYHEQAKHGGVSSGRYDVMFRHAS